MYLPQSTLLLPHPLLFTENCKPMKTKLLSLLLLFSFSLFGQPALTLDYYIQDGFHEYNLVLLDSTELNKNGSNVIWDFSKGEVKGASKSYSLDTLSLFYQNHYPELAVVEKRLSEIIAHQVYYHYLDFDQKITSIAEGFIDYDVFADVSTVYFDPAVLFPEDLDFEQTLKDTFIYQGYTFENNSRKLDTIQDITTFSYAAYGQFIHPNKDTFCDVIKITALVETHSGNSYETNTWYSKKANGILAETGNYYNGDLKNGLKRVSVKNMDLVNISANLLSSDTLIINHSLKKCGIQLSLFSIDACTNSNDYDIAFIDYFNDGIIEDTSLLIHPETHQPSFEIGTHRILWKHTQSDLPTLLEKIIIVKDIRKPSIDGIFYGGGYHLTIPRDSSSILISPNTLSIGAIDNNCQDDLIFRIWLDVMEVDSFPNPDSLSIESILANLPSSYNLSCFEERDKWFFGWIYVFDAAGNWDAKSIGVNVTSNECTYYCPSDTFTKLSVKDINGNSLNQIIPYEYGKEMEWQDGLYLYRVCEPNTTTSFALRKTSSVVENVSAFDLSLIQQHILGIKLFTTFQQFAAADVNYSGDITAFDLLTIKRTILGLNPRFNGDRSWVFFEQTEELLDMHPNIDVLPLHLLEEKHFLLKDTTYHFLGIKLGNVSTY